MTISLESCWAKLDRAKEHRGQLDRYVRDTFSIETNRPRVGMAFDAETGQHVLYVSSLPELGVFLGRVGLRLGDIMHNFRSALDHLTYQLALQHTAGRINRPQRVQFPILDDPRHFRSARGDALRDLHPDHQAVIERFQPYHPFADRLSVGPPAHPFAVLRDVDNADKIGVLRPVLMAPASLSAYHGEALSVLRQIVQRTGTSDGEPPLLARGTPLIRATFPPSVAATNTERAGHLIPRIGLSGGWPIDHLLDRIGALILKVIGEFQLLA